MTNAQVLDVNAPDFAAQESRLRPVVVDFWAPWCGPCRTLGPVLERLARASGGRWLLAKVNTDENPSLAGEYEISGIPNVKAFRDGKVVDEFSGALPEAQVRRWLEKLVPGPADEAVAAALAHLAAGSVAPARAELERALTLTPQHARALLELARLEAADGQVDAANALLARIEPEGLSRLAPDIAALRLQLRTAGLGSLADLQARLARDASDDAARLALGWAHAAKAEYRPALESFLELVRRHHRVGPGDEGRRAMLELFDVVGPRSDLAEEYRRALAQQLYR